jgi:hypothetical protein
VRVVGRSRLVRAVGLGVCALAIAAAGAFGARATPAAAWPNPCMLLSKVHAQTAIAKGRKVAVKLGTVTKNSIETTCSESVGKLSVELIIGGKSANTLSVPHVISESSVPALGPSSVITIGGALPGGETNGLPLDYVDFSKSGLFVALAVSNGTTTKAALTTVGKALFALVH